MGFRNGSELRQRNGVIPAHQYGNYTGLNHRTKLRFDPGIGIFDVPGDHRKIAVINTGAMFENIDVQCQVLRSQGYRTLAYRVRSQSLAGPVRSCTVPGNARNRKINPLDGLSMGQSHKRFNPGKFRLLLGCNRFEVRHNIYPSDVYDLIQEIPEQKNKN